MIELYYDLHLHSALSPCGDEDMTPNNIANMAALKGLQVISLTDHNSAGNCRALAEVCKDLGLLFVPGMEWNTAEEVHVLCYFHTVEQAEAMILFVYDTLHKIKNRTDIFGPQYYMDQEDRVIKEEPFLLTTASSIDIFQAQAVCDRFGGVAVPAHVDRDSYSLFANLAFLTPDMHFGALEISLAGNEEKLKKEHAEIGNRLLLHNSDAHYLYQIAEPRYRLAVKEFSSYAVVQVLKEALVFDKER